MAPKLRAFPQATREVKGPSVNDSSKPRQEAWSQMALELNPYTACPGGQALGLQVTVRDLPGLNPRHMGPAIWNGESIAAFGRQPGLEITPKGYILIRKLAAVFQSQGWNSTLYFIFSKSTVPLAFPCPWCTWLSRWAPGTCSERRGRS